MFKFYNPFRAHIVKFDDGRYAIRALEFPFGWTYLDSNLIRVDDYWWMTHNVRHAVLPTLELTEKRLDLYRNRQSHRKSKPDSGTPV